MDEEGVLKNVEQVIYVEFLHNFHKYCIDRGIKFFLEDWSGDASDQEASGGEHRCSQAAAPKRIQGD